MEHNEMNSMKSVDSRQSLNNGRIINNNSETKDERNTVVESNCKKSTLVSHVTESSGCGNLAGSTASASNSHKMGSRRIFTPQFKLQVLESYRNDNDCKGNQRATARKYNIHRRQIQKWLQCESSLRSSVANINQNTVKHQFHNISMHQQQVQKGSISSAATLMSGPYGSSGAGGQHAHLGLDATRSEAPHNTIIVPSLSSGVTTSTTQTQGVFSAANFAAAVAAAAGAAMTITNPQSSNGTSAPNESTASPLRPTTIIGSNSNAAATMSPLLHHHHHFGIPPYIHHTPATVQLPVPILTHHISHAQQIHQQAPQHQPYQYHNMAYTQALTYKSSDKHQSSFLSSISLPDVNALSAAASLAAGNGLSVVGEPETTNSLESSSKTGSENVTDGNNLELSSRLKIAYPRVEYNAIGHHPIYQYKEDGYALVYPLGPMDLSLRPRRNTKTDLPSAVLKDNISTRHVDTDTSIVDLTHRKRKVSSTTCNSADDSQAGLSDEKQLKLRTDEDIKFGNNSNSDEDEIEIEVGTEEKLPPSKPIKLFKPYLLDADADSESSNAISSASTEVKYSESKETSPWIRYTASISPPPNCYDVSAGQCQGTTFQYSLKDNCTSPVENSNFPAEAKTEDLKSAFTSIPTISPTSFRSPKGSPSSSGYESSSSTYSDSSISSRGESYAYNITYCLSLQMNSNHHDQINLQRSKHVERWLEQEARNSTEPVSPISILA